MDLKTTVRKIKELFTSKNRRLYVVLEGSYKGEWLVPVSYGPGQIVFFSLPDKHIRIIPSKEVEKGLQNKILDIVDILPKKVYNTCLAEYELKIKQDAQNVNTKQNNTPDRRKQHPSSSVLGSKQHRQAINKLQRN
jgi:hypothetical protein